MIPKSQAEAEAAFAEGNYSRAAFLAESDELRGAALAMVGALEESLPLLERQQSPRARFCRALAQWGLGQKEAALDALASIDRGAEYGEAAAKLSGLIGRDKIRILVQGRDDPKCPDYDLVGALRKIPYAEVVTVGYSPHADVVIDYTSSLDEVLEQLPPGWVPDVYLNHLVEDNPPPYGIETACFPTIFHSQDYDRHVQQCHGYLTLCDAVVALGSADHAELSALSGRPTLVYPLLLGIDVESERNTALPRTKDVYISGSLFNNGLGKAACVFDIAQLPETYAVDLIDGFVSPIEYYAQLGKAKTTFTYVNRWGALNGRAVEAISVGTCALVQEGTELQLYVSPEQGAIPYRKDNFLSVLDEVVREWDTRYAAYGQAGVARVKEVFEFTRCIQRYFNFLVATACRVDPRTRTPGTHGMSQPRYPTHSPWRIAFHFVDTDHVVRLQDRFRQHVARSGDYLHLDALGESLLYSYASLKRAGKAVKEVESASAAMLNGAARVYQVLVPQYPDRLAARFNLARILYEQRAYEAAAQAFTDILLTPDLQYIPHDTLFWKEIQENWFDYDVLMEQGMQFRMTGNPECLRRIIQAIRESAGFYLASVLVENGDSRSALDVLEALGELTFPRMLMLRAILRLQFGNGEGAGVDLQNALSQRPWDVLELDEDFFELAEQQRCPVAAWRATREQLSTRIRRVPKEWMQEQPRVERFVGLETRTAPTPEDMARVAKILATVEAWRASRAEYARAAGPRAEAFVPTAEQQAAFDPGYAALVSSGMAGVAQLRLLTEGISGSSIGALLNAYEKSINTGEPLAPDDGAKRLAFVRRHFPEELIAEPPLRFGEMGWLSDGHFLSADAYKPVERLVLLEGSGVLDRLRARAESGERVRVLELGAGYGSLAHLLTQAIPNSQYLIADWPEALAFSSTYLALSHPNATLAFADADRPTALLTTESNFGFLPYHMLPAWVNAGVTVDLVICAPDALAWSEVQVRAFCKLIRRLIGKQGILFEQSPPEVNQMASMNTIVRQFIPHSHMFGVRALPDHLLGMPYLWANTEIGDLIEC